MPDCPSGQRERTVNPPALPSLVRIHHLAQSQMANNNPVVTSLCGGGHRVLLCPGAGSGSGEGIDVVLTTFVAKSAELASKMRLEWPPGQPICVKRSWVVKLTQASSDAVKTIRRAKRSIAPLAQSAERFHGKEKVDGSIPSGGSVILCAPSRDVRHRPLTVRRKVASMAV